MGLVAVTGVFKTPNGAVYPSATVAFERASKALGVDQGVVVAPEVTRAVTDGAGALAVNLLAGDYFASVMVSGGLASVPVTVPNVLAADLAACIATPSGSYEVISWASYRNAVAAAAVVYATISAGIAAEADGALFFVGGNTTICLFRRAGATATPIWVEA